MTISNQQFEKEKNYSLSVYITQKMLDLNLITPKEYKTICKNADKKYHPILGDILLLNGLIIRL